MNFEQNKFHEKLGRVLGFVVAYFIFTTVLYFILKYLNKLPESWSYFYIAGITLIICFVGLLVRKLLK